MIIQSTNKPIIVDMGDEIQGRPIKAKLYDKKDNILEEWDENTIVYNSNIIELPLAENRTKDYLAGLSTLEIKWLNADNKIEFVEPIKILIVKRRDTSTFGGNDE